ncbi:MAG: hypothetical protein ACAI25_04545 [Planctomycetota bacterium]
MAYDPKRRRLTYGVAFPAALLSARRGGDPWSSEALTASLFALALHEVAKHKLGSIPVDPQEMPNARDRAIDYTCGFALGELGLKEVAFERVIFAIVTGSRHEARGVPHCRYPSGLRERTGEPGRGQRCEAVNAA